jgi:hypothetical protein
MAVTETVHKDDNQQPMDATDVSLRVSLGEYLIYRVTVSGAVPEFVLVDGDETLLESDVPKKVYETTWPDPKDASVAAGVKHQHTLGLNFNAAIKYTYEVEQHRVDDSLKKKLIFVDYESSTQEPGHFKNLTVSTV